MHSTGSYSLRELPVVVDDEKNAQLATGIGQRQRLLTFQLIAGQLAAQLKRLHPATHGQSDGLNQPSRIVPFGSQAIKSADAAQAGRKMMHGVVLRKSRVEARGRRRAAEVGSLCRPATASR